MLRAMPSLAELGAGLRRLRKAREWSQKALAQAAGVRSYKLREYESGVSMMVPTLGQILDALGANLCDLDRAIHGTVPAPQTAGEQAPPAVGSLLDTPQTVSFALRLLRQTKGIRAAALGAKLQVVEESVYAVEGSHQNLRMQTVERLLNGLGATLSELHETLVLADFLRQRQEAAGQVHLRLALQCLGLPHLPAAPERAALAQLRQLAEELVARWQPPALGSGTKPA